MYVRMCIIFAYVCIVYMHACSFILAYVYTYCICMLCSLFLIVQLTCLISTRDSTYFWVTCTLFQHLTSCTVLSTSYVFTNRVHLYLVLINNFL